VVASFLFLLLRIAYLIRIRPSLRTLSLLFQRFFPVVFPALTLSGFRRLKTKVLHLFFFFLTPCEFIAKLSHVFSLFAMAVFGAFSRWRRRGQSRFPPLLSCPAFSNLGILTGRFSRMITDRRCDSFLLFSFPSSVSFSLSFAMATDAHLLAVVHFPLSTFSRFTLARSLMQCMTLFPASNVPPPSLPFLERARLF